MKLLYCICINFFIFLIIPQFPLVASIGEGISNVGIISSITLIRELPEIATEFKLYSNYPNPFNSETKIKYSLDKPGYVILEIYDLTGTKIGLLVREEQNVGVYEVTLKTDNLSTGIYLCVLQAGGNRATNKMLYLK